MTAPSRTPSGPIASPESTWLDGTDVRLTPESMALWLAARPARWRLLLDFDPNHRYFRRLVADENAEAWLLTWLPGQGTAWHDHGGSQGALVVVQGELVERIAVHGLIRGARHIHRPDAARAFGPDHVHRLTNEGPDPAVSLHVYAPQLRMQHDYADDDGILRRVGTRRAGRDW